MMNFALKTRKFVLKTLIFNEKSIETHRFCIELRTVGLDFATSSASSPHSRLPFT